MASKQKKICLNPMHISTIEYDFNHGGKVRRWSRIDRR